jgi:hypothetical protein
MRGTCLLNNCIFLFNGGANRIRDEASTCQSSSTQIHLYGIMEKEHSLEGEALESVGVVTRLSDNVMSMAHNYVLQNTNVLVAFTFTYTGGPSRIM